MDLPALPRPSMQFGSNIGHSLYPRDPFACKDLQKLKERGYSIKDGLLKMR